MRLTLTAAACTGLLLLAACGGESTPTAPTTPPKSGTHPSISGNYLGLIRDEFVVHSRALDLSIRVNQFGGELSGTFKLEGIVVRDKAVSFTIAEAGTITGVVGTSTNASVSLTLRPERCPDNPSMLSGTYRAETRELTLDGPVIGFLSTRCQEVTNETTTVVLKR